MILLSNSSSMRRDFPLARQLVAERTGARDAGSLALNGRCRRFDIELQHQNERYGVDVSTLHPGAFPSSRGSWPFRPRGLTPSRHVRLAGTAAAATDSRAAVPRGVAQHPAPQHASL